MRGYAKDLAYILDSGFSGYCLKAAPGILRLLRRKGITQGLVVDLGCGSGRWARELNEAGYGVLGVDQSPAFIRLARKIAPRSKFTVESVWNVKLPACDAVTSIGECFNYSFDGKPGKRDLARLFSAVYRALRPGGVFIFDVAGPDRIPENGPNRLWHEGKDWTILVETAGRGSSALTRKIISFRKMNSVYRRSDEIHNLRLFGADTILQTLKSAGFRAEVLGGYGRFRPPRGISAFLAVKP